VLRKIAEDPRAPDALDRVIAQIEEIRKHLDGAAKLRHISTRLMRHYEKKLTPTAIEDARNLSNRQAQASSAAPRGRVTMGCQQMDDDFLPVRAWICLLDSRLV